jgi:Spy/CpxP family protein refolding chaperone
MLRLFLKTSTIALVVIFMTAIAANAQPYGDMQGKGHGRKAHKKMAMMKKVKLLEVLDLDEATSDKFLAKYSLWEKKIEEQRDKVRDAYDELESALKNYKDKATISKATENVIAMQNQMVKLMQDSQNDIKTVLSDVQFAKYVLFEHRFRSELKKMIMKRMHKGSKHNNKGRWDD